MRYRAAAIAAIGCLTLSASAAGQSEPAAEARDPWALVEQQLDPTLGEAERTDAAPGQGSELSPAAEEPPAGGDRAVLRRGGARREPRSEGTETTGPVSQPSYLRSAGSLAAVLALIGLCGWGYRTALLRGGLNWTGRVRRPGLMEVVSRLTLGPKHTLCLVRLGPRMVLVGLGPERVSTVDVISDPAVTAELAGEAQGGRREAEFARELSVEAEAYESPVEKAAVMDETQLPEAGRLVGLHGHLLGTLQKLKAAAGSGGSARRHR